MKNITLYTLFVCLLFATMAKAKSDYYIPGEVIVQLTSNTEQSTILKRINTELSETEKIEFVYTLSTRHNIHLFAFNPNAHNPTTLKQQLLALDGVKSVQDNYIIRFRNTEPNDPSFSQQWGAERIQANKVWDFSTGGTTTSGDTIVVAILDSGFDIDHEDIIDNMWTNHAEIPDDGIDNDNNGYIDDYFGWNFVDENDEHQVSSHGLSVAGILGAKGDNGIGVTGINWNVKLMLFTIKRIDEIIAAYDYVITQRERYNNSGGTNGAFVVATNASFGVENLFCEEQPTWGAMYDLMGEVGVLTGAGTSNSNVNVENVGDMPTTCTSEYLVTVLNTTQEDLKYSGSAFGKVSIDMGAPGDRSYTTKPNDSYGLFGGNSAAAPHLTGAIALMYSLPCAAFSENALSDPSGTALLVKQAILNGVDPIEDLDGITVTGGRLNVFNSANLVQEDCGGSTGDFEIIKVYPNPTSAIVRIEYQVPDFDEALLQVFNTLGQEVYTNKFNPSQFQIKTEIIDASTWPEGTYFIRFQKGEEYITRKFVRLN